MNTTLTTLEAGLPGTLIARYACGHNVIYHYTNSTPDRACPDAAHAEDSHAAPAA